MAGADPERLDRMYEQTAATSQSAKALAVSLAGVGALLLGGLQIANLGAVEGTGRILAAILGGSAAAVALIVAVVVTVGAMLPASTSFDDVGAIEANPAKRRWLARWLHENRGALLRSDDDTIGALTREYVAALEEQRDAFAAYYDTRDPGLARAAKKAGDWVEYLNGVIVEMLAAVALRETKRDVRRSKVVVGVLGVVIAAGVMSLIWATNPPEKPALDLRGGDLTGAKLHGVELRGANLDGMTIRGADLRGSYLGDASIQGTKWDRTICPDGVASGNAGRTCAGHLTP